MHENFQQAAHVIVHDEGLMHLPWSGDLGCASLAVLLTTWFTRAWTTLELIMSRKEKVSVIFRDSTDHNRFVIKNLENDILAHHPAYSSRGHWIASSHIRHLRERQFNSINDIQKVLNTKSTSWSQDLVVIAGLLTGNKPKVDNYGFVVNTTRDILRGLVEIEESFLYHGHATVASRGGFSWCPFSLFDGRIRNDEKLPQKLFVDEMGALIGRWRYRRISQDEATKKIHPYSFHVSVEHAIRSVLLRWKNCLLLQTDFRKDPRALLVTPVDVGRVTIDGTEYVVLDCLYVGTVYVGLSIQASSGESFTMPPAG